jgi:formate hydrogenlyase transcriptional activator
MKNSSQDQIYEHQLLVSECRQRIAEVKERNDLLKLLSSLLQKHFQFSGIFIQSVDRHTGTYYPFLIDHLSNARSLSEFKALSNTRAPLDDLIVRDAMVAEKSFIVYLENLVNEVAVPFWIQINFDYGIREALVTPLKIKDEVVGICYIWSDSLNSFGEGLACVMDSISIELGYAVSNTMIIEMLNHREWVNELLLTFSHDLAEARSCEDLKKAVDSGLRSLIHFDDFLITAINPENKAYKIYLTSLAPPIEQSEWVPSNPFVENICHKVAGINVPVIIEMDSLDTNDSPNWFRSANGKKEGELMLKIISVGAKALFALILVSNKKNIFDASDRLIVQRISSHLATAVSNVLVNEELEQKERDKSLLLSFSHDIASVRNKDDLKKAVEKVSRRLSKIARFLIRGMNDDQETMTIYLCDDNVKKGIEETGQQFILKAVYPVNDGISEMVLAGTETITFVLQDWIDAGKASSCIHFWKSLGALKCVATPLKTGGRNLGIFWVDSEYPDVKMIDSICAQLSIAMSNILANEELIKYKQRLEVENEHLHEQIRQIYNPSNIIGSSSKMQEVYELMSMVAHSNATVLIHGETGTGKELIARGIHESSPRKNKLMVKVNCAALPVTLIESELFGYERGAFTGAFERRIGKFELAHNGTLFLDEIGELPLEVQVKLLRVIQEREFERLGGKTTIKVDVRIIAATNRDLLAEVNAGRFRSDLYYRLNVFPITLPPLRERREDIPFLAQFFLSRYNKNHLCKVTGISAGTMNELKAYHWPGNVRELEHMIERSVLLSHSKILNKVYLPDVNTRKNSGNLQSAANLESVERRHIIDVLRRCSGKISGKGGAAELLNIPASTLNSKMKKLGITKNSTIE